MARPLSFNKSNTISIADLPQLNFSVNQNGSLIETDLKINIEDYDVNEIIDDKYVARVKLKVFAHKLGMMTLIMDKVKLGNKSSCFIYTPDYKIVAGPIYQNSIKEYLIIKNIPTDELIIEVVTNDLKDFSLRLREVNYYSLFESSDKLGKSKTKYSDMFLSSNDSCHTCNDGVKSYADFIDEVQDCGWLGYGHEGEIFNLLNFRGINVYDYDASRSSCVVLTPNCSTVESYYGNNGTLINFPYINCSNNEDCNNSFVVSVAHHSELQKIYLAEINNDLDYLNKVLIRFNWHHEYGTPWNLQNIDCSANQTNFETWRSSINFDEVIDYCGVNVFAYADDNPDKGDFIILKIKQKLFFKEHHLGWSEQRYFNYNISDLLLIDSNRFSIIGRRAIKPTMLIKNYDCDYQYNPKDQSADTYNQIRLTVRIRDVVNNTDIIVPTDFSGYSGSQLTYNDYIDSTQRIGIGIVRTGAPGYDRGYMGSRTYYNMFNLWDDIEILDACYPSYSNIIDYISNECSSIVLTNNYSYKISNDSYDTTCIWMPSLDNKQKCPSTNYVDEPCNFNITDYITWNDTTKCLTLDSISANLFPGGELPKGFRIYYNYGDQKTLHFDTYIDNLPIDLNYTHCFTSCELFDLYMQGKDSLILALDFYDSEGRILNNIGCERNEFKLKVSFDLCSMFDITAEKAQSESGCCTYTFNVTIKDSCAKNKPFLRKLAETLKLLKSSEDTGISLNSIEGISYNYNDGTLTFNRLLCDSNSNDKFIFAYEDGQIVCNSPDVNAEGCFCDCPDAEISKDWIDVVTTPGGVGESCPEGSCQITFNIDIPPFYNCYKFYKMGSTNRAITDGKATYSFCIPAGTARTDTILIKKNLADTNSCIIIKHSYCPIQSEPKFCKSGCDSVEWKLDSLTIPLAGCPNCFIKGKYISRTNNCEVPRKQELQVTEIEVYNTVGDSLACNPCLGNMADIHKKIILKAIYDNNMGFDPKAEDVIDSLCDETWRVSISSCWAEYRSSLDLFGGDLNHTPKKRYVPCDTVCCSIGLRVCRYFGPPQYITIDTLQGETNPNLCIEDSLFIYDPFIGGFGGGNPIGDPSGGSSSASYIVAGYNIPCINRCDWLDILTSEPYFGFGKRAVPYEPTNKIMVKNDCKLLTYLNDDALNCIFDSDVNSNNFSISIFSITGQLLLKENINVIKGYNEFTINLYGLNSGIYIIQAELNGICSKTDKLIIVK